MAVRFDAFVNWLERQGFEVENPKGGSHFTGKVKGARPFPLPRHGKDIPDRYVEECLKHIGLEKHAYRKNPKAKKKASQS